MGGLFSPVPVSHRFASFSAVGQFFIFVGLAAGFGGAVAAAADVPAPRSSETGLPFVDWISPRDYRGHSQVWAGVEDSEGILYFGNLNQVLVFDGARWSQLAIRDATFVRGLDVDEEDTLWIGGVDELGYAKRDATGSRTFVSLKEQLPPELREFGAVWRVIATADGIWFHAANALLRWKDDKFDCLPLTANSKRSLARVGTEIWLTGSAHDWFKVKVGPSQLELEPLPHRPEFRGSRVLGSAAAPPLPAPLIATDFQGLWQWDGTSFSLHTPAAAPTQSSSSIYGMSNLPDGRIVLNSLYTGIQIIDPSDHSTLRLDVDTGLADNTAICSFPSRDGNVLWVGLANGIARVDVRPWLSHFTAANGLPNAKVFSPARLRDTLHLPASSSGIYRLVVGSDSATARFEHVAAVDQLVNTATEVGDGLILGTTNGFFEWDGHTAPRQLPDTPTNGSAFIPLNTRPDTWAALDTTAVRLYRRDTAGWHSEGPIPGLDQARSLVEDTDGSWWSGRPVKGVFHTTFSAGLTAPVVTELRAPESLPENHGWTRFGSDTKGPLLACERGLFRFNPHTRRFEPTADYGEELADGSLGIFGFTADDRGGLWLVVRPNDEHDAVASYLSLLVYGRAGRLHRVDLPHLSEIEDPTHLQFEPASPTGRPATLWVAGQSALIRLDLDRWQSTPAAPPPRLLWRGLQTGGGRKLDLRGGWELTNLDRSLRVELAAPALGHDSAAIYETTFQSSHGTEVRTNHNPEREFSALGSGHYTLTARARHPGGIWSEPRRISFSVLPPWWLSPVALTVYVAIIGWIIWLMWRWRTAHLIRRQQQLETLVTERTAALAEQNAELVKLRQIDIDEKLDARLAEHQARLEVLRYQLNPHFLFNTLNAICAQIIRSPRTARETVIRLADFCRLTLHRPHGDQDPTFEQEIAMLRAYLEIEQTRMGDLLHYEINADPDLNTFSLPPILLLPLVENAVKHGAATSEDSLHVRISFARQPDGAVLIEVANTGRWTPPGTTSASVPSLGIGLENLRQRLDRYFPQRHELTQISQDGWVIMRLRLSTPEQCLSSSSS